MFCVLTINHHCNRIIKIWSLSPVSHSSHTQGELEKLNQSTDAINRCETELEVSLMDTYTHTHTHTHTVQGQDAVYRIQLFSLLCDVGLLTLHCPQLHTAITDSNSLSRSHTHTHTHTHTHCLSLIKPICKDTEGSWRWYPFKLKELHVNLSERLGV